MNNNYTLDTPLIDIKKIIGTRAYNVLKTQNYLKLRDIYESYDKYTKKWWGHPPYTFKSYIMCMPYCGKMSTKIIIGVLEDINRREILNTLNERIKILKFEGDIR